MITNFQRKKMKSATKIKQTAAIETAIKEPLSGEVVDEKMMRKMRSEIETMAMRRTNRNHILYSSRLSRN